MVVKSSLFLFLIVFHSTATAQLNLHKINFQTYDEAVNQLQSQELVRLMNEANKSKTGAACDPQNPTTPEPPKAYAYLCEITSPLPSPSPVKTPPHQVSFYLDNDNLMMGLIPSGNDEGFTHRMGFAYLTQLKKNQSLQFDVSSEIYTKRAETTWDTQTPITNGSQIIYRRSDQENQYPVNFIDVTRFKAAYSKGKSFYFKAAIGMEIRQTQVGADKLPPAASVQNWWHHTLGIYTYEYVSADGVKTQVDQNGNTAVVKNGFKEDPLLKTTSKTSVLVDGAVGKKIEFFEGRCELQLETGVSISSEKNKMVGPNSTLSGSANVKTDLIRKKNQSPRLTTSLGGAIFYFPSPQSSGVQKTGSYSTFTVASSHHVGKQGNTLQPFFTFWLPSGRQLFTNMNDLDMIQRIGMRFKF